MQIQKQIQQARPLGFNCKLDDGAIVYVTIDEIVTFIGVGIHGRDYLESMARQNILTLHRAERIDWDNAGASHDVTVHGYILCSGQYTDPFLMFGRPCWDHSRPLSGF